MPDPLFIGPTEIEDAFAEAFGMRCCRLIITAADAYWLETACRQVTGHASSVIGCDVEAGVERFLEPSETPDSLPGAQVLFFGFSTSSLGGTVANRVGQNLLTCPTVAVYDGLPLAEDRLPLGQRLRFFGDGRQKSKQFAGRRFWRIPIMQGEFLVEESVGCIRGIAGGNIILQAKDQEMGLAAVRRAVEAARSVPGVILPFPGGVVASGSKVGSRYAALKASTNHEFCPALQGREATLLAKGAHCAYEIVIDGMHTQAIEDSMRAAILAACGEGVLRISAGNYGGNLGKHHYYLHKILAA